MPLIIEPIDKICRDKERDVLYIMFDKQVFSDLHWQSWPARNDILAWFYKNNITTSYCGVIANEYIISSYRGEIYIDVPYHEHDPDFVKVSNFLENEDGSAKIEGVLFCYLPLAAALKNQHHDEPGFW